MKYIKRLIRWFKNLRKEDKIFPLRLENPTIQYSTHSMVIIQGTGTLLTMPLTGGDRVYGMSITDKEPSLFIVRKTNSSPPKWGFVRMDNQGSHFTNDMLWIEQ